MYKKQKNLTGVAKVLDVNYQWLRYRIVTRQTPIAPAIAYTDHDVEKLKRWLESVKQGQAASLQN